MELIKSFIVLLFIPGLLAADEDWKLPYFEENKLLVTKVKQNDKEVSFAFDENVEAESVLGEITYYGNILPDLRSEGGTEYFKLVNESGKFKLKNVVAIDYEKITEISFRIVVLKISVSFTVSINNLNDNPMIIILPGTQCLIMENRAPPDTECEYTISDLDGIDENINISEISNYKETFFMKWAGDYIGLKQAKVFLYTKESLDFEKTQMYLFTWTVKDLVFNDTASIVVNVDDAPDTPPIWTTIFATKQFKEHVDQTFEVSAIDGDIKINDEILYECKDIDDRLPTEVIKCDLCDNKKEFCIYVKNLDRDEHDLNTVIFKIIATEKNLPKFSITQEITFIIDDINDNIPEIIVNEKSIEMRENEYRSMDDLIKIEINDIDLAENARYKVELHSLVDNFTTAIQIVPSVGYQSGNFSLTIINAALLDYDKNIQMRDFEFKIVPIETVKNECREVKNQTIKMKLINWNDEKPIFKKDEYRVTINETFGRKEVERLDISDLYAIDLDFGDHVSYELLGSAVNNILKIENKVPGNPNDDVVINTILQSSETKQIFDYERDKEVIIQLKARDNFPNCDISNPPCDIHTAIAQITIELLDVNDETPSISITHQSTRLDENVAHGTTITSTPDSTNPDIIEISVFDGDAGAKLEVFINWDESSRTKNGQKGDWGMYKDCIIIETVADPNRPEVYIMKTNEVVANNTPDFEVFDTLNLKIVVIDTLQEVGIGEASLMFVININNVNDCLPIFDNKTIEATKTVMEHSIEGQVIGAIRATDEDFDAEIKYYIKSVENKELIDLNELTGEISVKGDIDADSDVPIYFLNFTVRAWDGEFEDTAEITISVIDTNDQKPAFVNEIIDMSIEEHSPNGTIVTEVKTFDKDRDEPYNVIKYSLKHDENTRNLFHIHEDYGTITIINSEELDRDVGDFIYKIDINIMDNPTNKGPTVNTNSTTFRLTLLDINDNYPIISTANLPDIDERIKEDDEIGIIEAHDKDEIGNDNSKIKFEILNIINTNPGGKQLHKDDMKISTDAENMSGKGTIKSSIKLEGYYGEYLLEIKTEDFGKPPLNCTKNISLNIKTYNFNVPKFIYPNNSKLPILLQKDQDVGKTLMTSYGQYLSPFEAQSDPEGKYNVIISVIDPTGTFELKRNNLVYKIQPNETKSYDLKLIATDDGKPSKSSEVELTIKFMDRGTEPSYSNNNITVYFDELLACDEHVKTATADQDAIDVDVNYYLYEDEEDAFTVEKKTGDLVINKLIVRENLTNPYIRILASKETSPPVDPQLKSILNVKIELQSVNYRPPFFEPDNYYGGIMTSYDIGKQILTVKGRDYDENDTLTYRILEETLEPIGEGITKEHTFNIAQINNEEANILLGFKVQSNMDGRFVFVVEVSDTKHTANTTVTVIIISQADHIIEFNFENNIHDVEDKKTVIPEVFTDVLKVQCVIDDIVKATDDNGIIIDTTTQVKMHFIEENLPVSGDEMISKIIDPNNYSQLRRRFVSHSLIMTDVTQNNKPSNDNDNKSLMIWFISVSVVLGSLCIILIVAFILKTRSLSMRLNKLSTTKFESMSSNLNITAVPTSNRNAVEGSNPIYQVDVKENNMDFDRESISSGESDLIGIENNPTFATNSDNFGERSKNPTAPPFYPDLDSFL